MSYIDGEFTSPISSPICIGDGSIVSDVESVLNLDNLDANKAPESPCVLDDSGGAKLFDLGDGDIELRVNNNSLATHKYLLKRFSGLKDLILNVDAGHNPATPVTVKGEQSFEDFRNTFKILHASVIEGPFEFDTSTLISALRIASAYGYPGLRSFAITNLKRGPLSAIERIRLAREFGLTSWEGPAYVELCERDEAITIQEANVLGLDVFVRMAKMREEEQRRRGKEIDALAKEKRVNKVTEVQYEGVGKLVTNGLELADGRQSGSEMMMQHGESGDLKPERLCSFDDTRLNGEYSAYQRNSSPDSCIIELAPLDCQCSVSNGTTWNHHAQAYEPMTIKGQCRIPSCAVKALKYLRAQQLTRTKTMTELETTVKELKASLNPTLTSHATLNTILCHSNEPVHPRDNVSKWLSQTVDADVPA